MFFVSRTIKGPWVTYTVLIRLKLFLVSLQVFDNVLLLKLSIDLFILKCGVPYYHFTWCCINARKTENNLVSKKAFVDLYKLDA